MKIKLLESFNGIPAGRVITVADPIAKDLISRGIAVKEKAIDKEAHDSINDAKARDQQQGTDAG